MFSQSINIGAILPLLFLLSFTYRVSAQSIELRRVYTTDTLDLAQQIQWAGSQLQRNENLDSAFQLSQTTFRKSCFIHYRNGIKESAMMLTQLHIQRGEPQQALQYALMAERYTDMLLDKAELSALYYSIGNIYMNLKQKIKAQEYLLRAAKYAQPSSLEQGKIFNSLSALYLGSTQLEKAWHYINQAGAIAIALQHPRLKAEVLVNRGFYFKLGGNTNAAILYFDSAIWLSNKHQYYSDMIISYAQLVELYSSTGSPEKGKFVLKNAVHILNTEKIGPNYQFTLFLTAGILYSQLKEYENAEHYLLKAYQLPQARQSPNYSTLLHELAAHYYVTNQYKKAYNMHLQSHVLMNQENSKEIRVKLLDIETKYQTAEKDKKLVETQLKIARQGKQMSLYRNWIILGTALAIIIILILGSRYLYLKQKTKRLQSEAEVERLKAIMEGAEGERYRLAHELHDGINSQLSALQAFLLAEECKHPFLQTSDDFRAAHQVLEETASDVRSIAHNLAPDRLLEQGLQGAVTDFCQHVFNPLGIDAEVTFYGSFTDLDQQLQLHLYRIIQELVQNIKKHAQADTVSVLVYRDEKEIRITVGDNGRGISDEGREQKKTHGLGLSGIAERVGRLKGIFELDTVPGKGTSVHIVLPLT